MEEQSRSQQTTPSGKGKEAGGEKRDPAKDKKEEQELSEEDKQLQDELEMLVERLGEKDSSLYKPALEELRRQIRSSTTSMTSVPKPLKFLRPHYGKLKEIYESMEPGENKRFAADIISVLAMTMSGDRECLKYRLFGSQEELASWGHEYVRHLAGEVAKEWQEVEESDKSQRDTLLTLVKEIVPYNMAHNTEHEACDLLMEIEQMDMLEKYIDDNAYSKVCLYLTSCVSYVPEPENSSLLRCALSIFRKFNRYPEALRLALILNDMELVEDIFTSCKDVLQLRYGEPTLRRAVPLALALISVSNPRLNILDTLSKFSHDADPEVSYNSIFAMGMVGSGTNNARLAAMLRQLAQYHAKDPNNLFMVRLAQGLTHLGKGTLTLCPYHSDRQLMSQVAVAGLLTVLVSFLDVRNIVLGKSHYILYGLVAAMQPRMLVTFDEELRPLPVSVRVGQAVDVVGQAGKPKTITGFQTHTTPVLLAHGERAELATEEYLPVTPILEGFVILRKNPNYDV
ncbi:26S proteasome non-ATPase regulatory subunit 2 [Bufo gargarizans]|uniref:26S proteasome non-ATPase regulatory subunit 2 n=1 Tax=Bufo gargarizans TaxID=30331 RepID=UPI001CF417F3|nr:26S proteasome non-ATPase regulatory subunit 2 [Bufo gargarizans]